MVCGVHASTRCCCWACFLLCDVLILLAGCCVGARLLSRRTAVLRQLF